MLGNCKYLLLVIEFVYHPLSKDLRVWCAFGGEGPAAIDKKPQRWRDEVSKLSLDDDDEYEYAKCIPVTYLLKGNLLKGKFSV